VAACGILLFRLFYGWLAQNPVPAQFLLTVVIINVYLAAFNLIPIPPLDGSGVLEGLLPARWLRSYWQLRPYGFIILIVLLYLNVIDWIARPILGLVFFLIGV